MAQDYNYYVNQAKAQTRGNYLGEKAKLDNDFASQKYEYNNNVANQTKTYADNLKKLQNALILDRNNVANQMIGRGLARSSMATTGIKNIENTAYSNVSANSEAKKKALEQLSLAWSIAKNNYANSDKGLMASHMSDVYTLAEQLRQADLDRELQERLANM